MILGVLPPQGGSIASLKAAGQAGRFIHSYLGHYARHFERVYYFSYANEAVDLPPNCVLVKNPGFHRWFYAFSLPLIQRRYFQACDVLRVMQMTGALPALVARLLYRKSFVGTYGYNYRAFARLQGMPLRGELFEWRAHLGLRWADGVIVTNPGLQAELLPKVPANRLVYLPNGVDTKIFKPSQPHPPSLERKVIFVGRLDPVKNLFMLVEALALIQDFSLRLVLVGDGPLRQPLGEQAAQLGVACDFAGTVLNETLPERLNAADVFVLPSQREGHPKALLEAMSCALPCIGTDVEGIREVIQDGKNGLLCALTPQDLADKICRLVSDPDLAQQLGQEARRFVEANFDLDQLLEEETRYLAGLAARQRSNSGGRA
jgi:glycosyltransferase involved in cell wall biosynthesis